MECLLVALVTVVCIQQAGAVLSVMRKSKNVIKTKRQKATKAHRQPQEERKTLEEDFCNLVCYRNGNKVRSTAKPE